MSSDERWFREIEVRGVVYEAEFIRRPFREGLEVQVHLPSGAISVAELGLGEMALVEKAKALIEAELDRLKS